MAEQFSSAAEMIEHLNSFFGKHGKLTPGNYQDLSSVLNQETLRGILLGILDDQPSCEAIAKSSYRHPLGFSKLDLGYSKSFTGAESFRSGFEARVHVWDPESMEDAARDIQMLSQRTMVEGRHQHGGWNFASYVAVNSMENHRYTLRELDENERKLFERFQAILARFNPGEAEAICARIDQMESLDLLDSGSQIPISFGGKKKIQRSIGIKDLLKTLDPITYEELQIIRCCFLKYANFRKIGEETEHYQEIGVKHLSPFDFQYNRAGQLYFHPFEVPHRLFLSGAYTATFLVTDPSEHDSPSSGELVRSRNRTIEDVRGRHYFTFKEVQEQVLKLLNAMGD